MVEDMRAHVAQRAAAEVPPPSPPDRRVDQMIEGRKGDITDFGEMENQ
jgi:hypothetical protein